MEETKSHGKVTRKELQKAIVDGIKKAQDDYWQMSGFWVWQGSEYWITTYVARKLWKVLGDYTVVIEGSSDQTRKEAGNKKRGRTPSGVKNKRYDIVAYFKNEKPRAVIEIKSQQSATTVVGDVRRVVDALNTAKLRFGAIGYYYSKRDDISGTGKKALHKVKDYAEDLLDKTKEITDKEKFSVDSKIYTSVHEESAWLAGCIIIERKTGNTLK